MRKPTPKYANVTATLALFVALGGTSYAAATISSADVQNGSLTGADVKNESLKSGDVDNGSLTGSYLKNGSVKSSDIGNASLLAADFKAGELPAGPQGPQGPQGIQGPQGPAGATNVVTRRTDNIVPAGGVERHTVQCAAGEVAVGGGAGFGGFAFDDRIIVFSEPIEADGTIPEAGERPTGWSAGGGNASGFPQVMNVHVLCASP